MDRCSLANKVLAILLKLVLAVFKSNINCKTTCYLMILVYKTTVTKLCRTLWSYMKMKSWECLCISSSCDQSWLEFLNHTATAYDLWLCFYCTISDYSYLASACLRTGIKWLHDHWHLCLKQFSTSFSNPQATNILRY